MHGQDSGVRRLRRLVFCSAAVVALLTLVSTVWAGPLPVSHSAAPGTTSLIRCEPSSPYGGTDVPLPVDIYIEDVVGLYGADVQMTFDTAIAQVVDADPVAPGVQIQPISTFLRPDFVLFKSADNDAGTIHYALTQLNPHEPATGSGPLARVQLQPSRAGEFTLSFVYHSLSDRNGVQIPSVVQDCTVTFSEVPPVRSPTPSPTPTASATPAPPDTATPTPTATSTRSLTATPTYTATATKTVTVSPGTATDTPSPTATASTTPTAGTATPTATPSRESTNTPSATPSVTAVIPSPTATDAPSAATIQGAVFLDANRDGKRDPGERGIAEVLIWAYGVNTGSSRFAHTQEDGSYRLPDLPTGVLYLVQEFDPPGFVSTTSNWAFVDLPHEATGQTMHQSFGDWRQETYRVYLPLAAY